MSTESAPKTPQADQILAKTSSDHALIDAVINASDPPTKTDMSAAVLERALRHVSDERKTERFFWIAACMGLLDFAAAISNAWALAGLIPFELVILLGLAHWLEVDFIKRPLQQLLDRYTLKKEGKKD